MKVSQKAAKNECSQEQVVGINYSQRRLQKNFFPGTL